MSTIENEIRLPTRLVMQRYNVADRTIDRWISDPKVGFPKPLVVNRRRYFRLRELEQWERRRATAKA